MRISDLQRIVDYSHKDEAQSFDEFIHDHGLVAEDAELTIEELESLARDMDPESHIFCSIVAVMDFLADN